MDEKFLFVGGPVDGKWRVTRGAPRAEVTTCDMPKVGFGYEPHVSTWDRHLYDAELFRTADGDRIMFYRHESLTLPQALHRLLQGYKP